MESNNENRACYETEFAIQEWGIKNGLRLFGTLIDNMNFHGVGGPAEKVALRAKAIFTDTAFKTMELHILDIKKNAGKISIRKTPKLPSFKYPIKFARTKEFDSRLIIPAYPLYQVLIDRGIILPFQSKMKNKEWGALPFEDMGDMKSTKI